MVRVLAVADEVVDSLSAGVAAEMAPDVIVSAGDLPFDYLERLMNACAVPCVYVPGNHDRDLSGYRHGRGGWTRAGLPAEDPGPCGGVNLDGRIATVAGLTFAGLGGSIRYNGGANQYTEHGQCWRALRLTMTRLLRRRRVDVLVAHSPAAGVGDGDDPPHRGFRAFIGLVKRLDPQALLHGHVHPHGDRPANLTIGAAQSINVVGYCLLDLDPAERTLTILRRRYGA